MRTLLGASMTNNKSLDDHILASDLIESQLSGTVDVVQSKKTTDLLNKSVTFTPNFTKNALATSAELSIEQLQTIMQYHKNYGGLKVVDNIYSSFFSS